MDKKDFNLENEMEELRKKYSKSIKDVAEEYKVSVLDLMEKTPKQNLYIETEILEDLQRNLLSEVQKAANQINEKLK